MSLEISNHQRERKIDLRLLKKIAEEILAQLEIENAQLEINLVGAKKMAEINWKFLQHKGSTDVITFDYLEKRKTENGKRKKLHGELFVGVDEAVAQAKNFKTSWQSEIVRYIVHGILHLCGHDDLKPGLRRKMKRAENRLLRILSRKFSFAQLARPARLRA